MKLHIQEYIVRSGRIHVFQTAYETIPHALAGLRSRIRQTMYSYRVYDYEADPLGSIYTDKAHIETDNKTYADVISEGGARRRYTIVTKRKGEPVPFGHLIDRGR